MSETVKLYGVIFPCLVTITALTILIKLHFTSYHVEVNTSTKNAFATFTTPSFCMGAVALGKSIEKNHGNKYDRVCLVTPDVNSTWRKILRKYWIVKEVFPYRPMKHFRRSWAKTAIWNLTQYKKVIYLDSDTLVLKPIDELFGYPQLSCVPDPNPPQICNTGVLVIEPRNGFFKEFSSFAKKAKNVFAIGDQGTINAFFKTFTHLPAKYNAVRGPTPGFKKMLHQNNISILHYVCKKPWKCGRDGTCGCGYPSLNKFWWNAFDEACEGIDCIESYAE